MITLQKNIRNRITYVNKIEYNNPKNATLADAIIKFDVISNFVGIHYIFKLVVYPKIS